MDRNEILEKTLGNRIVILVKETHRAVGSKQEIYSRVAESLKEMFGLLRRSGKSTQDKST